jgi:hypothetical protein
MPMKPIREIHEQANALVSDFLLIDSQTALILLDRAEDDSAREEDRTRRFRAANEAYSTIIKLLPRTTLTQGQCETLTKNLIALRGRLDRHLATYRKVA